MPIARRSPCKVVDSVIVDSVSLVQSAGYVDIAVKSLFSEITGNEAARGHSVDVIIAEDDDPLMFLYRPAHSGRRRFHALHAERIQHRGQPCVEKAVGPFSIVYAPRSKYHGDKRVDAILRQTYRIVPVVAVNFPSIVNHRNTSVCN